MATLDGDELIPLDRVLKAANGLANAARNVAKEYTPIGWTGQLRSSVQALPAVVEGNLLIIELTAGARSADGEEYAEKQHETPLRHVSQAPFVSSFGDVPPAKRQRMGAGDAEGFDMMGPAERKYWAGLANSPEAPVFATKFLEVGANKAIDQYADEILGGFLSG